MAKDGEKPTLPFDLRELTVLQYVYDLGAVRHAFEIQQEQSGQNLQRVSRQRSYLLSACIGIEDAFAAFSRTKEMLSAEAPRTVGFTEEAYENLVRAVVQVRRAISGVAQ